MSIVGLVVAGCFGAIQATNGFEWAFCFWRWFWDVRGFEKTDLFFV